MWYALLLLATASELLDASGRAGAQQHGAAEAHTAAATLSWQQAAPSQPAASAPAASAPDANQARMSSPAWLPLEILWSAERGDVQSAFSWLLHKGGAIDAFAKSGQATASLLHAAAVNGHLGLVSELLKRGVSPDLPARNGFTALRTAATHGHL